MIKVKKVENKQFPYEITINSDKIKFTYLAFEELFKKIMEVRKVESLYISKTKSVNSFCSQCGKNINLPRNENSNVTLSR